MAERIGLAEQVSMLENRLRRMESTQSRNAEDVQIRLDGIGSNELTDSELTVMMEIMNDGGENFTNQLLTMKKMIIGLAEYCRKNRERIRALEE